MLHELPYKSVKNFYVDNYEVDSSLLPNPESNYRYFSNGDVVCAVEIKYDSIAFIWHLVVSKSKRGQGLGAGFITELEDHLRLLGVYQLIGFILSGNTPSLSLAIKEGFIIEGTISSKYGRSYLVNKVI